MTTDQLQVTRIQRCCVHDGPGIRTTLFLQGCTLRCWWCHNPESRPLAGGTPRPVDGLAEELLRDRRFWDGSGGGVTISGGEPLLQAAGVTRLLARLGAVGVHRAVETAAAVPQAALEHVAPEVDLWLVDLKAGDAETLRRHTGAGLDRILARLAWLQGQGAALRIRIPVIRGVHDTPQAWTEHIAALGRLPRRPVVELLPGHDWGHAKAGTGPRACAVDATVVDGFAIALRAAGIPLHGDPPCIP